MRARLWCARAVLYNIMTSLSVLVGVSSFSFSWGSTHTCVQSATEKFFLARKTSPENYRFYYIRRWMLFKWNRRTLDASAAVLLLRDSSHGAKHHKKQSETCFLFCACKNSPFRTFDPQKKNERSEKHKMPININQEIFSVVPLQIQPSDEWWGYFYSPIPERETSTIFFGRRSLRRQQKCWRRKKERKNFPFRESLDT